MVPGPAVVLAQPEPSEPQKGSLPPELRALMSGSSLDADVRALGSALEPARRTSRKDDLRVSQRVARW